MSRRVTRADKALTEMKRHLDWLRDHAQNHEDNVRIVGVMECMDILRNNGARLIESEAPDA